MLASLEVYTVAVAHAYHLTGVQEYAPVLLRNPTILAGESPRLLLRASEHQGEFREDAHRGWSHQQDRRRASVGCCAATLNYADQDARAIGYVGGRGEKACLEVVDAERKDHHV